MVEFSGLKALVVPFAVLPEPFVVFRSKPGPEVGIFQLNVGSLHVLRPKHLTLEPKLPCSSRDAGASRIVDRVNVLGRFVNLLHLARWQAHGLKVVLDKGRGLVEDPGVCEELIETNLQPVLVC